MSYKNKRFNRISLDITYVKEILWYPKRSREKYLAPSFYP